MLRWSALQIMLVGIIVAAVPNSMMIVIMRRAVVSVGIGPVIVPIPVMPVVVWITVAVPVYPLRGAAICNLSIIGNGIAGVYGNSILRGLSDIVGIGQGLLRNVIAG